MTSRDNQDRVGWRMTVARTTSSREHPFSCDQRDSTETLTSCEGEEKSQHAFLLPRKEGTAIRKAVDEAEAEAWLSCHKTECH